MRHLLRTVAVAAVFLCLIPVAASAQFVGPLPVFDFSNYAKNTLTELNTLKITVNQATEIANQLREIALEVQDLKNIPNGVWGEIHQDLEALTQVAKVGQSISYADQGLTVEFTQMYPGYSAPTNYAGAYKQWSQNTLGGIQGALQVAGVQSSQLATEQQTMARLQSLSNGALGTMEALQTGNMIAVQEVQQLQKLREINMAQMQGEFAYLATEEQTQTSTYVMLSNWFASQSTYRSSE